VFRAYDAERERLVAVKLFKLDLPPERVHQLVAAFEGLVGADLNHPVIARPIAAGISGVSAFLAQDYVAAESLDLAVREYGPAPAADAVRVAAQLAAAIDFARIVNVHHGSLHPRDVLLASEDTRLTGLGVAQALQKVGVAVPVRRPYTAPEAISNGGGSNRSDAGVADGDRSSRSAAGAKADLFSLAAVVYELLTGKRVAGTGERAAEGIAEISGADTDALRKVFARALATNADERFDTALAFVDALKATVGESPAASRRASVVDAPRQTTVEPSRHEPDDMRLAAGLPFDVPEASDRADVEPPVVVPVEETASDLPLAAAEERRYEDVESGSVVPLAAVEEARESEPPTPYNLVTAPPPRARAAVWPLALALFIGLAVGFAGGYGVGSHDRTTPDSTLAPARAPTAGREFTEAAAPPTIERPKSQVASGATASAPAAERPVPRPQPPAAASVGHLLVRSTPAGARVSVDGKDAGVTPSVVRDLAPGSHRVRVSRDGFTAVERKVVITRNQPSQSLTVPLQREQRTASRGTQAAVPEPTTPGTAGRFVGALYVDSRPTGAKVFLDGKLIGTTPLSMASVTAGEHAVRLEYDGFRRWSSSVRVVASEQNRVTASLER
jgi:PEGA domain-containing protein/protein kinase-like protein